MMRDSRVHLPLVVGGVVFLGFVVLFVYSALVKGTRMSGLGWSLGSLLYDLLEEVSGFLGFTRSYEVLLGWPLVGWLLFYSLAFGAFGWVVAEGVRSVYLRVRRGGGNWNS